MSRVIAIIGAGPVGLAAGAWCLERGLAPIILEQGPRAGHAVRQWAHVRMFSNWGLNIDAAAARLLEASGWQRPCSSAHPTGTELVERYLEPLAALPALRSAIRYSHRVLAVTRKGVDKVRTAGRASAPFEIMAQTPEGPARFEAAALIDCSGTWFSPAPGGAAGLPATGEADAAARIAYGMPDVLGAARERYAGRRVGVLGGGHSAVGTLIDLARLASADPDTRPVWLCRAATLTRALGGGKADQLAERGALGTHIGELVSAGRIAVETGFMLSDIAMTGSDLAVTDRYASPARQILLDELVIATGFRPDLSFLRELRVDLDPALECPPVLAPLIDPNLHSCGTVRPHGAAELAHPEADFYIAGMKAYGRAPTFLLATGNEQVRSIVAELDGDHAAARRVELVLPETGVCTLTLTVPQEALLPVLSGSTAASQAACA